MICCANQLTGFYMRAALTLNGLKENLKAKLQIASGKCILYQSIVLTKINWLSVNDRVELWLLDRIVLGYWIVLELFMKSLSLHSADIAQDHRWH